VLLGQVAHDLPLKTLFGRRLRDEMLARAWIDDHGRAVRIQLRSTARPRLGDANASWDTLELWDFGADLDIATPTGI
jgi:hypothetical protein